MQRLPNSYEKDKSWLLPKSTLGFAKEITFFFVMYKIPLISIWKKNIDYVSSRKGEDRLNNFY